MVTQGLTPTVQHRNEADPGTEMSGIGGDDPQGLGGGPEQDAIDDLRSPAGSNRWRLAGSLWKAIAAISAGSVKTTWI